MKKPKQRKRKKRAVSREPIATRAMLNTEPGYVFRGTSSWHWQRIVDEQQGLRARRDKTGTQWEDVPSHRDFVYFAASPVDIVWNYRELMQRGELEVLAVKLSQLDPAKLYPDEDFLALVAGEPTPEGAVKWREGIERNRGLWKLSLATPSHSTAHGGAVAYKGTVPLSKLRVKTISEDAELTRLWGIRTLVESGMPVAAAREYLERTKRLQDGVRGAVSLATR
jgi:hypothetical protein